MSTLFEPDSHKCCSKEEHLKNLHVFRHMWQCSWECLIFQALFFMFGSWLLGYLPADRPLWSTQWRLHRPSPPSRLWSRSHYKRQGKKIASELPLWDSCSQHIVFERGQTPPKKCRGLSSIHCGLAYSTIAKNCIIEFLKCISEPAFGQAFNLCPSDRMKRRLIGLPHTKSEMYRKALICKPP